MQSTLIYFSPKNCGRMYFMSLYHRYVEKTYCEPKSVSQLLVNFCIYNSCPNSFFRPVIKILINCLTKLFRATSGWGKRGPITLIFQVRQDSHFLLKSTFMFFSSCLFFNILFLSAFSYVVRWIRSYSASLDKRRTQLS